MNAQLLEKLIAYREKCGLAVSRLLLYHKINYQFHIVNKKNMILQHSEKISQADTISALLLIEARAAKIYWKFFGKILQKKINWRGRCAHADDPANKLLDIGYHYLTQRIVKVCQEIELPTEIGFFHKAQTANAHPIVYDFIEWMRPIIVDDTLLKFLGKKKKPVVEVNEKLIAHFLRHVKDRFERRFYHKKLKYCITLEYWIRMLLLQFMGAVRTDEEYSPLFPSMRHEMRCTKQKIEKPL